VQELFKDIDQDRARSFVGRDIISPLDFEKDEILFLLDVAQRFEKFREPILPGRILAALFYEPSTRTRSPGFPWRRISRTRRALIATPPRPRRHPRARRR
jgi:hypothetical protein